MPPFKQNFRSAQADGIFMGVDLPIESDIPPEIWNQLHPSEQKLAESFQGKRRVSFVGGRIAARLALQTIQQDNLCLDRDSLGAPVISNKQSTISLSITHKANQAIALLNRQRNVSVGLDLEHLQPERRGITERVLTESEQRRMAELPSERQWCYTLLIFSFKEAIYKALAPKWKRYIGFEEAEVIPSNDMTAKVSIFPREDDIVPKELDARYMWHGDSIVTSILAKW